MITTTHNLQQEKVHLWLTLAGLTGIVSLFLPFTFGISPLMALFYPVEWRLATPAFLTILVAGASLRWILSGSFLRAEKAIAYIFSMASACVTLSVLYIFFRESWPPTDPWGTFILILVIPLFVLLSGSWLLITKLKQKSSREYCPIIALQVAYLADCLLCLILYCPLLGSFFTGWQIGAWFSQATAMIYLFQIYLFVTKRDKTPDRNHETERGN